MSRRLLIFTFLLLSLHLFSADIAKQGIKGGINFCNLNFEGVMGNSQSKFTLGSYSTYRSKSILSFQGEGYVSFKGSNIDTNSFDLIYLDIDLLSRIDLDIDGDIKPYFLAGPYMGIKIKGEFNSIKIANLRPFEFGGVLAAGIRIDKFSIEYRYSPGFTTIFKGGGNVKNEISSLLIGYEIELETLY